jgi:hypothetical protein
MIWPMGRMKLRPDVEARLAAHAVEHGMSAAAYVTALINFADWAEALLPYHEMAGSMGLKDLRQNGLEQAGLVPDHD